MFNDFSSKSKKIVAIFIVAILVISIFALWFVYVRPWSVEELSSKFIGPIGNPSFPPDFANMTVTVTGVPIGKIVWQTNRGPMTVLEFDIADNSLEFIALRTWGEGASYAVGERMYMQVSFEWSIFNNESCVLSPQLCFPGVGYLLPIETVTSAVNHAQGVYYEINQTADGGIRISLLDVSRPCNLSSSNCSLRSFIHGGSAVTYIDVLGMPDINHGSIGMDHINDLSLKEGENGLIEYQDSNDNGMMDTGDSILIDGLRKPTMQSGALSYMFVLNSSFGPNESDHRHIDCFIVMYSEGLTRLINAEYPYCRFNDLSNQTQIKAEVAYVAGNAYWNELLITLRDGHFNPVSDWNLSGIRFSDSSPSFAYLSSDTVSLDINCTIVDLKGNGLIDKGDYLILTPTNGTAFIPQDCPYIFRMMNNARTSQLCSFEYYI